MSTQHTPGKLWVAYGQIWGGDGVDKQLSIAKADRDEPRTTPVERDRNIERLASCWNACDGMADPQLDIADIRTWMPRATATIKQLKAERKELVAALSQLYAVCPHGDTTWRQREVAHQLITKHK